MEGVSASVWLHDDCRLYHGVLLLEGPAWAMDLPAWNGGMDPHRYGHLARMRRAVAAEFLASDCDYLYFHDVDTIPPWDIIPRLLALDVPTASGSYSMRGQRHAFPPWMEPRAETLGWDVVTAAGYGMGCMLLRRDVLEKTEFRAPEYWEGLDAPGEDWQFTLDAELPVAVDTRCSCWHVCEDGEASRIEFGDMVNLTVWMGAEPVETFLGTWRPNQQREDVTPEQQAALCVETPTGFACGAAREMYLEWADVKDILCGVVDGLAEADRRYERRQMSERKS
jgi:hypothetical protein